MPETNDTRTVRPVCQRCERPVSVCYCAALTTQETRSRVVILQHPRESGNAIGTAHMAHLCLPHSSLHVGIEWDDSDAFREACADPDLPPVLLYPAPDARDILREPPTSPVTLIVIDGTWSQARSVVRKSSRLAALPRYAFHAPEPTNYRIRSEPRAEYVSTLEALVHVLGAIEGDAERFRALLRPMDAMVDAQLAAQARNPRPRKAQPRPRLAPFERLPQAVRERFDDLVLVFGDANAWPHGTPQHRPGGELIHWVACRLSTNETFEFVIAPRDPLSPNATGHTGLSTERILAGGATAEMLRAFAAFIRPTDVITSWGHHGLRLFRDCGGPPPDEYLDLRRAARVLTNRSNGTLERYATTVRDELPPDSVSDDADRRALTLPTGRAGRRLGMLVDIVDAWRQYAHERPRRGSMAPVPVEFRELEPDDAPLLRDIDRSEFIDGQYRVVDGALALEAVSIDSPGWSAAQTTAYVTRLEALLRAGGRAIGAWRNGRLVGLAALVTAGVDGDPALLLLDMLYVSRESRGTGIGTTLTRMIGDVARALGAATLYISATPTRATVDTYLRMGAVLTDSPSPTLLDREPDDIHVLLSLGTHGRADPQRPL